MALCALPDVRIKDVAEALDIHAFMLSRWRKEAREGRILTKKRLPEAEPAGVPDRGDVPSTRPLPTFEMERSASLRAPYVKRYAPYCPE